MRDGYTLLSLSQAIDRLASDTAFGDRSAVITLDDGFQDNYEHALPILTRLKVPATIFLTVGYIGTGRLPTLTRTDFMPRPLDWREVKEMQAQGIEFGSHTITHPMLSQVPLDVARREIGESKRMLEDRLGTDVPFFCYPRGDVNEAVRRIVRDEGYRAACSTLARPQRPADRPLRIEADVYQPPRLPAGVRQEDGGRLRPPAASADRLEAPAPPLTVAGLFGRR